MFILPQMAKNICILSVKYFYYKMCFEKMHYYKARQKQNKQTM